MVVCKYAHGNGVLCTKGGGMRECTNKGQQIVFSIGGSMGVCSREKKRVL